MEEISKKFTNFLCKIKRFYIIFHLSTILYHTLVIFAWHGNNLPNFLFDETDGFVVILASPM